MIRRKGSAASTIKDVISRNMYKRHRHFGTGHSHRRGRITIDHRGQCFVLFGLIHSGEGSSIDHHLGLKASDHIATMQRLR